MKEENKEEDIIVRNLTEARKKFFKDTGKIFDYFSNFGLTTEVEKNNKYSEFPWVDFNLDIYPKYIDIDELSAFIGFGHQFYISFDESCIKISKRYYLKEVSIK